MNIHIFKSQNNHCFYKKLINVKISQADIKQKTVAVEFVCLLF